MNTIKKLEHFSGKRNAVITLMIPKNKNLLLLLKPIQRKVSAIKHKNKRYQINKVLKFIIEENKDTIQFLNPTIICCGFNEHDLPIYHKLDVPNEIKEFEYHYGYTFHIERIKEIYFNDIITKLDSKLEKTKRNELKKEINNDSGYIVFKEEIDDSLEMKMIKELYWFSDQPINYELIYDAKNGKAIIVKMNMEDLNNVDFSKKYGEILGMLRYPMNFEKID